MATVLLSFLGRVPKEANGYRTTCYDFGDSRPEPPTAFFGWSLQRRLAPDRLVILGTTGSMWDHLFEGDPTFNAGGHEALALIDAVENKSVTVELLNPLIPLLQQRFGCGIELGLIPYCHHKAEQVELLRIMADHVARGDHVHLDVTHGFRHLPMLAVLAALHLRSVRHATIDGIWYGAYDPDTKQAPVYDLAGLLHIADWLQALNTYDKDGDYGVFADLIDADAGSAARLLKQAAFLEKINSVGQARGALREFRQTLSQNSGDPLLNLFADELTQRSAWVENRSLAERQYELALHFLEHRDYLRAAILGFESLVTRLVQAAPGQLDPMNYAHRDQVISEWNQSISGPYRDRTPTQQAYYDLREFRNILAHGSRSNFADIQDAMSSEDKLHTALSQAIELAHQGSFSG